MDHRETGSDLIKLKPLSLILFNAGNTKIKPSRFNSEQENNGYCNGRSWDLLQIFMETWSHLNYCWCVSLLCWSHKQLA